MERKAKTVVVALFLLLSLLALLLFYQWVVGSRSEAGQPQRILFNGPVSGLSVGSEVRYLGVSLGRVAAINLSEDRPGHVWVDFSSSQPLRAEQLLAQLEPLGITGLAIIELRLKSEQEPGFDAGTGVIAGYPSLLTLVSGSLSAASGSTSALLARANTLLSEQRVESLGDSIEQFNRVAGNLAAASDELQGLMQSMQRVSSELESTLPAYRQLGQQLHTELMPAVLQTADELHNTSRQASRLLADSSGGLQRLFDHDIPKLVSLSDDLSRSLQGVNELVQHIDDDPKRLLYGEQLPQLEVSFDDQ